MRKPDLQQKNGSISAHSFKTSFRNLIISAWTVPPVAGFSFLLYIRMFSGDQVLGILMTPLENLFIVGTLLSAIWYFNRYIQPVVRYIETGDRRCTEQAVKIMRRFPLHFWSIFLIYIVIAPSTVIVSAEWNTDFVALPVDWFRIHLIALIVSIIVGLPIFFLILDLFGKVIGSIGLDKPHITIKAKVFMIGALVPLLIDTMLVQYYWTRTGFFSFETFIVWFALQLIAVAGSIVFARSFSLSIQPLQCWGGLDRSLNEQDLDLLRPQSTDELGVLATNYRKLIENWRINNEILEINTQLLRSSGSAASLSEVVDDILRVCEEMLNDDIVFLILRSKSGDELVGVAQTGKQYSAEGYYRLSLEETSLAVWIYKHGKRAAIKDAAVDERVSDRMCEHFKVKSTIGVPLQIGDDTIGVLMTISQTRLHDYSKRECLLLEGIAREIAVAVQTHQLYQDRMTAELARQDNEELLHLLMSATAEGIYGVDINGLCIFINPAGLKMLGYEREDEILGKSIHEMIHHSHTDGSPYPKDQCAVKLATARGASDHSENDMHWRKDGSGFPVEYWSHPIYKTGKIVGAVVTFIDITERMKTLEKLKYQAQVIDQVRDSIVATDLKGNVTSWNKGAERLFGYTEEFMLGRNIALIYPKDELSVLTALIAKLQDHGTHETEARMLRKDGTDFHANLSLSMLYDENNMPIGMAGYLVDITERKLSEKTIKHQAYHDKLTGLPNRWLLQDRIAQSIAISSRDNRCGALMFLDLDRFKKINDTLGHEFGDEVLLVIANRLSALVREGDTLARLGGDEFVMLLTTLHGVSEASDVAKRILHEIKQPIQVRGRDVHLGGSIGIAGYPDHGKDSDTLLKHADFAMYHAKEKGGDNYQFYTAEIHEQASNRYQLEYELHYAIENEEIDVHYQPQYKIETGELVGLEALCRWTSPTLGDVAAQEFISVAEETGLITSLGVRIFNRVIENIFSWKEKGIKLPRIAINLSAKQIYSEETFEMIRHVIVDRGLPGNVLEFEITESSLMDDPQLAAEKINAIKELGASIAIDDFGTGYSSLAYLKRFSVDMLKIDRSFVCDLVTDADDRAIIETIIGMADNLGLSVIAEGIENEEQVKFLQERGCHIAQGFLYSKPLSAENCEKLLMDSPGKS